MAILQIFEKQPGETKAWPVSFAKYLARTGDEAIPSNPVEHQADSGISIVAVVWVAEGNYLKFWVSGGVSGKAYKVTFWLNTLGGERLEADVRVKVKDT